jgi:hypothetical protein
MSDRRALFVPAGIDTRALAQDIRLLGKGSHIIGGHDGVLAPHVVERCHPVEKGVDGADA